MAKFCFYYGSDADLAARMRQAAAFCWGRSEEIAAGDFRLFIASEDTPRSLFRAGGVIGAISGYADRNGCGHAGLFCELTGGNWPMNDEWSGSFAAAAYLADACEITLCNDIIGHHPLYYSEAGAGFAGGTSIIVLGKSLRSEPDPVGVLQRITVPFCNYGRRTLLQNIHRLSPGERLAWSAGRGEIRREYDNTLCRDVIDDADVKTLARIVWKCLREETLTAVGEDREVSVATSGGWDSRLILGVFPRKGMSVNCLTYGSDDLYEAKIARRCADAISASHQCFPIEERYFPSRSEIEELVKETESANYFEWLNMIESTRKNGEKPVLLLGDLCESIDGRYMLGVSTRKARIGSALAGMFGKKEKFAAADEANFENWRSTERTRLISLLMSNLKHLSADLLCLYPQERLRSEIESDLEISFARVQANAPKFAATYDELFTWFHRIRFLLGNQITWLASAFRPVSPGLSMRFMRLISNIHPQRRIRRRLMNAMMALPDFEKLTAIPTAQIPFVPSRAPGVIKDAVWAARSGMDQLLIRRSMKNKRGGIRQRVLTSLDYIREYRRPETGVNVESWFSDRHIKSDNYRRLVRDRANLDAWTLINVDVAAPANVSMILDLCRVEPTQGEDHLEPDPVAPVSSAGLSQTPQTRDPCLPEYVAGR